MKTSLLISATLSVALILGAAVSGPTASSAPVVPDPVGTAACGRLEQPEYIGVSGCKKCHFKQWLSWKKTPMAKAFATLQPGKAAEAKKKYGLDPQKDYTKDAKCLACHTTGYGKPGGYPALVAGKVWTAGENERASKREGVQCESCHGPGSLTAVYKKDNEQYAKADVLQRGLVEPKKENCVSCHNDESPTISATEPFDFDAAVKDDAKLHKHTKLKYEH